MKILIVDPFSSGRHLAPLLSRGGAEVFAAVSSPHLADFYLRTLNREDFKEVFLMPADRSALDRFTFDQVIAGSEPGVDLANEISTRLKLPGHDPALRTARRDKFEMQNTLKLNGIRSIPQAKVASLDELDSWMSKKITSFPIILKPLRSAGTDGVQVIESRLAAEKYLAQQAGSKNVMGETNAEFLAQALIKGVEYVVDTVSDRGRHIVQAVWKYNKNETAGAVLYDTMELLTQDRTPNGLLEYTFKALDTLGITHGPAHTELFLDESGPVLCETGARIHGGMGPILAKKALSFNQIEATAALTLKQPISPTAWMDSRSAYAMEVFGQNQSAGILSKSYTPLHPAVAEFNLIEKMGTPLPVTRDLITSPSRLLIASRDSDLVAKEYKNFRNWEKQIGYV